jgi:CRP-like cAMP-binding protein
MMQQLNKNLKEKVQIDMYFKVLIKSRIIRENLSIKSIQQLCSYVKEKQYVPEEYVFMQGDVAKMLICIQKGEISFYAD